jgi:alpha-N-arabinofuranosidase
MAEKPYEQNHDTSDNSKESTILEQVGESSRIPLGRRNFLGGVASLGTLGALSSTVSAQASGDAVISVDPSTATDWTVNKRIFGKFIEHNGRDAYPGIYSDHVANGSFEIWNIPTAGDRTAVLYPETPTYKEIAYPWEPVEEAGTIDFAQNAGGKHGREAEPDLESGDGVPSDKRPNPSDITQPRYQRIFLTPSDSDTARGGVKQRTALPDDRTLKYIVEFSVRGQRNDTCDVRLEAPDGSASAAETVPVTQKWNRRTVTLQLDTQSSNRYQGSPFGEYELSFVAEGRGRVDLDWVMLRAGDAINEKFNPTTVELLDQFNVTSLRWPGGNFTSQYHWQDGVGPLEDRPVVPNVNWGGLERNYLGTNEFLEFCEITGIEPIINVGFWSEISPEEAANWVEYVNGDQSTKMGKLRTKHGYSEPWGVTSWQVGNEVYGQYQIGNVDVYEYADEFQRYHDAMKAADSSIDVHAVGIDPMYTDFHDGSGDTHLGEPPIWNRELFNNAGQSVMSIDIHRYVRGIVNRAVRNNWLDTNDTDPVGYNEVLVNFPSEFDQLMQEVVEEAAQYGIDGLEIDVGEWNLQPRVSPGWPRADYPTMAHAAFMASMFTTFMRRGNAISMSHMRDNSLFWRPYPIDFRPVPPGDYAAQTFAEPFVDGITEWNRISATIDSPTLTIPETGIRIRRMENVPYVDAAAIRDADSQSRVIVYVTNRNLRETYTVEVDVEGWSPTGDPSSAQVPVVLQTPTNDNPFARQTSWTTTNGFDRETVPKEPNANGNIELSMPPASIAMLEITLSSG